MKKITLVKELEKDLLVSGRFILCEKKNISELHKQDVNTKIKTCDKASKKGIRERFLQNFLSVSNSFNIRV